MFLGLTMLMSFNAYAGANGWKQENNKWKYYKEDKALKAWQQINNNWYFFNEDGSLKTGWYMDASNNWYFLDSSKTSNEGVLLSGWQWIDGYCYYFDPTPGKDCGVMVVGKTTPDGFKINENGQWTDDSGKVQYVAGKGFSTSNSGTTGGGSNTSTDTSKDSKSRREKSSGQRRSHGGSGSGGSSGGAGQSRNPNEKPKAPEN